MGKKCEMHVKGCGGEKEEIDSKEGVSKGRASKEKGHKEWVFKEKRGKKCKDTEKTCKGDVVKCKEKMKERAAKEEVRKTVKVHTESVNKKESRDKKDHELRVKLKAEHE